MEDGLPCRQNDAGEAKGRESILLPEACYLCGATLELGVVKINVSGETLIRVVAMVCPHGCEN
jgi:hypothetical protein